MAKTYELRMAVEIAAPRAAVWARVADHEGVPSWTPVKKVKIVEDGAPERGGLGAVRAVWFPSAPMVRERITRYEPERAYAYKIFSGFPGLADHTGTVSLEDLDGGGTRFRWDIDFRFKPYHPFAWIAPWWIKRFERQLTGAMQELKRQLESPATPTP
jgi:uncharacterized protein YndB with AHSA1/START domain